MTINTLRDYIQKIKNLNRYKRRDKGKAPYKPFLLLVVIELIEQRAIRENQIILSDDLIALFKKYVSLKPEWGSGINNPFFYLKNEGFWHLYPEELGRRKSEPSVRGFRDAGAYANLDHNLFILLTVPEYRDIIRQTLINTYFPELRQKIEDLIVGEAGEAYSEQLIRDAKSPFSPLRDVEAIPVETPVRSAGFRRAIMKIYNYMCAVCELDIRTANGESMTDAAHIIPFSVSYNDDVRNGISLCKSHHWAFDAGLISLNEAYHVIVSSSMSERGPTRWMLTELRDKSIWLPENNQHRPAQDALAWHRERVLTE